MSIVVASGNTICIRSGNVGCVREFFKSVANAEGGGGNGSLRPGPCISPPNAKVALEITKMVAKRKHRSLFIVLNPFGVK